MRSRRRQWSSLAAWWLAPLLLATGCIDGIVVIDEPRRLVAPPDATLEEDSSEPEPARDAEPEPASDASQPVPTPPAMDAGTPPAPARDASGESEAGKEAGPSLPTSDAGGAKDAGCEAGKCDSGVPTGPCAACGPATLIQPADCPNGTPVVCWYDPSGECSMQCPSTDTCSASDPRSCGTGRYCYFPRDNCGSGTLGLCAPAPSECPSIGTRVCGCDGVWYPNLCAAHKAGTASNDDDSRCR